MKRWCLNRGIQITSGWEECQKCRFYLTTLCPGFRPNVTVVLNEFANWFDKMKRKTDFEVAENPDSPCEVQRSERE